MVAKKLAKIRVAGPDHKGIIAAVTSYLADNNINIEDIDQRILEGILVMNMVVDVTGLRGIGRFNAGLRRVSREIQMDIDFKPIEKRKLKRIAIVVTKESHCLLEILKQIKKGKIKGLPVVILSNQKGLGSIAAKYHIPFFYKPSAVKKDHERFLLKMLRDHNVDLVVLARYMQILSPEFVFQYEGRIINIHPSLLPSFPGARAYEQAFERGVEVVGVTAHFVTTDLDRGPIICQDSFKIEKGRDSVDEIRLRGQSLEAKVLARAVKLFSDDRLFLRRGKVLDSRKLHSFGEQMDSFYEL